MDVDVCDHKWSCTHTHTGVWIDDARFRNIYSIQKPALAISSLGSITTISPDRADAGGINHPCAVHYTFPQNR